jgi:4-hydroxybenzoyl-CoA thioesterase
MTPYRSEILVRFAHCDAAGIVFYPRYIEMFNNLVEDWCRDLDIPYAEIRDGRGQGLPAVHVEADFAAPSRAGEILSATLTVRTVGTSSLTLDILFQGPDGADRVRGLLVVVLVDVQSKRPIPIPAAVREKLRVISPAE